jgi:uncharacterized membrane protein
MEKAIHLISVMLIIGFGLYILFFSSSWFALEPYEKYGFSGLLIVYGIYRVYYYFIKKEKKKRYE